VPIVPDALDDQQAARAEAHVAQTAYRRRVRSASLAIVFGLAAVLASQRSSRRRTPRIARGSSSPPA